MCPSPSRVPPVEETGRLLEEMTEAEAQGEEEWEGEGEGEEEEEEEEEEMR